MPGCGENPQWLRRATFGHLRDIPLRGSSCLDCRRQSVWIHKTHTSDDLPQYNQAKLLARLQLDLGRVVRGEHTGTKIGPRACQLCDRGKKHLPGPV